VINIRDKKYLKDFGKHLRDIRTKAAITQEGLGLDAGLGKNQVGLIERGEVNVTISTLKKLAKSLRVEPKELLDF
jgi:transcriptional regulator with XRE-family HTH domain